MVHLGLGDSFFIVVGCLFISCPWFIGIVSGISVVLIRWLYFWFGLFFILGVVWHALPKYVQISAIIL